MPKLPTKRTKRRISARKGGGFEVYGPTSGVWTSVSNVMPHGLYRTDPTKDCYVLAPNDVVADAIETLSREHGFELSEDAREMMDAIRSTDWRQPLLEPPTTVNASHGSDKEPWPFQESAIWFFHERANQWEEKGVLLADQMGCGKTVSALLSMEYCDAYPLLVLCPANAKSQWVEHIREWLPWLRVQAVEGFTGQVKDTMDAWVCNYTILADSGSYTGHWETFQDLQLQGVIMDEIHYLKDPTSARSKAARKVIRGVPYRLGLTGTPIPDNPEDLIHPFDLLNRLDEVGPSPDGFEDKFVKYEDQWVTITDEYGRRKRKKVRKQAGVKNVDQLRRLMYSSFVLRRTKKDAMPWLPSFKRINHEVKLSNRSEYDKAEDNLPAWIRDKFHSDEAEERVEALKAAEELVEMSMLRRVTGRGKLSALYSWAEDVIYDGEKLVVFVHHRENADELMDRFGDSAVQYVGGMSTSAREKAKDRFGDENVDVMVANIDAAGTALDGLQHHASTCAFLELGWSPGPHKQAEDRLHRGGQEEPVDAHYFLANGTVDERLWETLYSKQRDIDHIIDGIEPSD